MKKTRKRMSGVEGLLLLVGLGAGQSWADPMPFADSENLDQLIDRDSKIPFAHQELPTQAVLEAAEALRTSIFEIAGKATLAKKKRLESQTKTSAEMVETINVLQPKR